MRSAVQSCSRAPRKLRVTASAVTRFLLRNESAHISGHRQPLPAHVAVKATCTRFVPKAREKSASARIFTKRPFPLRPPPANARTTRRSCFAASSQNRQCAGGAHLHGARPNDSFAWTAVPPRTGPPAFPPPVPEHGALASGWPVNLPSGCTGWIRDTRFRPKAWCPHMSSGCIHTSTATPKSLR